MTSKLHTTQIQMPDGFIDLGRGDPQLALLPRQLIHDSAVHLLTQPENEYLQYGMEQGSDYFRMALARYLSIQYGYSVLPDNLFTTSGISAGLDLLCSLFTKAGDTIFVEEPSYFLALQIFADHGLRIVSIQTDESGLVIDDLIHALEEYHPKFLYVIPTFQNPSGRTLSLSRREQLVSLAKEHNFLLLADEVYHFLNYTQTPPKSFGAFIDSTQVISLGSFSKILAPGLRLGWLHTNSSMLEKITSSGVLASGGGMNPFTSALVTNLIENGGLEKNVKTLVQTYKERIITMAELLREHLPTAEFTTPHGGYFFWVRLPGIDITELRKKAGEFQVGLRQGPLFSSNQSLPDFMRLSVSYYDVNDIEQGLLRLKKSIA